MPANIEWMKEQVGKGRCPFCGELVKLEEIETEEEKREFKETGVCPSCLSQIRKRTDPIMFAAYAEWKKFKKKESFIKGGVVMNNVRVANELRKIAGELAAELDKEERRQIDARWGRRRWCPWRGRMGYRYGYRPMGYRYGYRYGYRPFGYAYGYRYGYRPFGYAYGYRYGYPWGYGYRYRY